MNEQQVRDLLRDLAGEVAPGPAPVEATMAAGRGPRNRPARRAATALVAAVIAVIAVLAVRDHRSTPDPVGPPAPLPSIPSGATWWGDGALHIGQRTIPVQDGAGDVGWVLALPDGALLGRANGDVTQVKDNGQTLTVGNFRGREEHGPSFVRDPSTGWVAWTDGTEITVFEPSTRGLVGTMRADSFRGATAWLIAFDRGVVYWDNSLRESTWDVTTGVTRPTTSGAGSYVRDARDDNWLVLADTDTGGLGWQPDAADATTVVDLSGGVDRRPGFSATARRVGLWDPDDHALTVFDLSSTPLPSSTVPLPDGRLADAAWIDDDRIMALLDTGTDRRLLVCEVTTTSCAAVAQGPDLVIASERPTSFPDTDTPPW